MPRYINKASKAVVPLAALTEQLLADLDLEHGGIGWWCDHLDPARRILIGDYLIGLTHSTEANLVEAVMHAQKAQELRYAHGRHQKQQISSGRLFSPRDNRQTDRSVEIDAHLGGFFRAVGSVMDNIAGLVVGVAGLKTKIVKADIGDLRLDKATPKGALPDGSPGRDLQMQLVQAVKASVDTGPPDWWPWLDDMRNTWVHRARRLGLHMYDNKTNEFVLPLAQAPAQTDAEAMARSDAPFADALHEDAQVTVDGALAVVTDVVRSTAAAAVAAWQTRRANPTLILQPTDQWPVIEQGRATEFTGWAPTSLPTFAEGQGTISMNPNTTRRLEAGNFLDEQREQWRDWITNPAPRP